jgi:hypothetical protein
MGKDYPFSMGQQNLGHHILILGTLDDKIELNRRMNETLEAAARAIFKSWFVDFDPVRAKLRTLVKRVLRKYGYPPDKQEKATLTVLAQAELLCADWAG